MPNMKHRETAYFEGNLCNMVYLPQRAIYIALEQRSVAVCCRGASVSSQLTILEEELPFMKDNILESSTLAS